MASLFLASVVVSCGGGDGDDESTVEDTPSTEASAEAPDSDAPDSAGAVTTESTPATNGESGDESSGAASSGETPNCDAIFSMAEMSSRSASSFSR